MKTTYKAKQSNMKTTTTMSSFLCLYVICLTLFNPILSNAQYFFIIGESLLDAGNARFTSQNLPPAFSLPYGRTFFDHPTGRFTDGRVVPDFIATKLNLPFPPPALDPDADFSHGANFASGGANAIGFNPNAMNLPQQYGNLTLFKSRWIQKYGYAETQRKLREAVFLIGMGGNDYFSFDSNNLQNVSLAALEVHVNNVIEALKDTIEKIHTEIGINKFMLQNVGPLGCQPMFKQRFEITGDGCARRSLTLSVLHNAALVEMAKSLAHKYPQFIYSIFDFHTIISEMIRDPHHYGFKHGAVSCCGVGPNRGGGCGRRNQTIEESCGYDAELDYTVCCNPDEHVFFDGGHNTDAAHKKLADIMWSGDTKYVYPYNMKQLFDWDNRVDVIMKTGRNNKFFSAN